MLEDSKKCLQENNACINLKDFIGKPVKDCCGNEIGKVESLKVEDGSVVATFNIKEMDMSVCCNIMR